MIRFRPMISASNLVRSEVHDGRRWASRSGCLWFGIVSVLMAVAVGVGCSVGTGPAAGDAGTTQRGFALPTWEKAGYDGPQVEQSFREMVGVGATWVQLNPTWYQAARSASDIGRSPTSVSDAGLERAIALAHAHGLRVFLKPHVDLQNPDQGSRSTIRPDDREAWFASYTAFIGYYAAMAERTGVEQLAVGTELASVTDDRAAWLQVIQAVRARYHGTVVYAADPDEYARVPFWDAVDLIGIEAYWPLSKGSTTDERLLQRSWNSIRADLAAFSAQKRRKILFTEAGYTSQDGTTTAPYDWTLSTTPNQAEQAAAYQSLLEAFSNEPWWAGVYWWVWNTLPDNGDGHELDFSPRGKAVESVIRSWWAT